MDDDDLDFCDEYDFPLTNKYQAYLHLPQDSDWSIKSYKTIGQFSRIDEMLEFFKQMPPVLIEKGMLFVMKENILPLWEDHENKLGGSFCYKVPLSQVVETFKLMVYALAGRCISSNMAFVEDVTGITISPKLGGFCILKIWTSGTKYQDPTIVNAKIFKDPNTAKGCIFRKHTS